MAADPDGVAADHSGQKDGGVRPAAPPRSELDGTNSASIISGVKKLHAPAVPPAVRSAKDDSSSALRTAGASSLGTAQEHPVPTPRTTTPLLHISFLNKTSSELRAHVWDVGFGLSRQAIAVLTAESEKEKLNPHVSSELIDTNIGTTARMLRCPATSEESADSTAPGEHHGAARSGGAPRAVVFALATGHFRTFGQVAENLASFVGLDEPRPHEPGLSARPCRYVIVVTRDEAEASGKAWYGMRHSAAAARVDVVAELRRIEREVFGGVNFFWVVAKSRTADRQFDAEAVATVIGKRLREYGQWAAWVADEEASSPAAAQERGEEQKEKARDDRLAKRRGLSSVAGKGGEAVSSAVSSFPAVSPPKNSPKAPGRNSSNEGRTKNEDDPLLILGWDAKSVARLDTSPILTKLSEIYTQIFARHARILNPVFSSNTAIPSLTLFQNLNAPVHGAVGGAQLQNAILEAQQFFPPAAAHGGYGRGFEESFETYVSRQLENAFAVRVRKWMGVLAVLPPPAAFLRWRDDTNKNRFENIWFRTRPDVVTSTKPDFERVAVAIYGV